MKDLILRAVPGFIGGMALEWMAARRRQHDTYEPRDATTSIAMGLANLLAEAASRRLSQRLYDWCHARRLLDLEPRGPLGWALLIVLDDLSYYWFHRLSHEVRLLWASHVNHHSSERYNLSTALRQSWTSPLTKPPFSALLVWLGYRPEHVKTASALNLLYQFWVHTELIERLGPLEWVLNTPSHHRVHHGADAACLDRNYGGIFILWDRLFGTFQAEEGAIRYGLVKNLNTHHLLTVACHEWRDIARDVARSRSLRERLGHVFGAPGWRAGDDTQTAAGLRRAWEATAPRAERDRRAWNKQP